MAQRSDLLTLITREPRTLAELVRLTGASLPTLRRMLAELEADRIVTVVGRDASRGGRPAQRFGLDPGGAIVLGVHLVHPGMRLVAASLTGEVLEEHVPDLGALDPADVTAEVARYADAVRARYARRPVCGIGVATPGFVDPLSGTILSIGRAPAWRHVPLTERLVGATGMRVTVHNDMDALASSDVSGQEPVATLVYVGYGEGLKFSLMIDGTPYAGPFGNAGLAPDALFARLGRADDAALWRVPGLVAAVDGADVVEAQPRHATRSRFDEILAAYEQGDPSVAPVVDRMIEVLGAETAAVVHLMQPATLIFGGALAGAPDVVLAGLERTVRASLPTLLDHALHVRPARLVGPRSTALGATRAFLARHFADATPLSTVGS
jgi:predicted NBD/HSP70 family sugar kinase